MVTRQVRAPTVLAALCCLQLLKRSSASIMLSYAPRALALVVDAVHNIDLPVQSGSGKRPGILRHAANPGKERVWGSKS